MNIWQIQLKTILLISGLVIVIYYTSLFFKDISKDKLSSNVDINTKSLLIDGCDLLSDSLNCRLIDSSVIRLWLPVSSGNDLEVTFDNRPVRLNDSVNDRFYSHRFDNNISGNKEMSNTSLRGIPKEIQFLKAEGAGIILEIPIPLGKHHLLIVNQINNAEERVKIERLDTPAWLKRHILAKKERNFNKAINILQLALNVSTEKDKALIFHYLARDYLAIEKIDEAIINFKNSIELFQKAGDHNKVVDNMTVLTYVYLFIKDDAIKAKSIIERLPSSSDVKSKFYKEFYSGHLLNYIGDLYGAESHYLAAKKIAEQFKLEKELIDTQHMYSRVLINSGQINRGIKIREEIITKIPKSWSNCRKLKYHNGLGWAKNQLLGSGSQGAGVQSVEMDPIPDLQYSLSLLEKSCPESSIEKINILINLSKAFYLKNEIIESRKLLFKVQKLKSKLSHRQLMELTELQGLLSLEEKNTKNAIQKFKQLLSLAEKMVFSDFVIKAQSGLAQAYELNGENEMALSYYSKAQTLLFDKSLTIPVSLSRPHFLASKLDFSYRYVGLLSRLKKTKEAMTIARKFRSNSISNNFRIDQLVISQLSSNKKWLRTLSRINQLRKSILSQQSLEWSLPYDQVGQARKLLGQQQHELSMLFDKGARLVRTHTINSKMTEYTPKENELFLFFYPIEQGWISFSYTQDSLLSHVINIEHGSHAVPETMLTEWLAEFSLMIDGVETIKVFPYGIMNQVDFHQIPYKSSTLLSYKNIHYGVDLMHSNANFKTNLSNVSAHSLTHSSTQKKSLIVANSLGDLKATEKEALTVARKLNRLNWLSKILTNEQTTFTSVKENLENVSHFHYAGHVIQTKNNTDNNVTSYQLPLTDNVSLNSNDILMLSSAPKWVVLSACNSATSENRLATESISLANAFIISGSEQVIATMRPVSDKLAQIFMNEFYQHWSPQKDFVKSFRLAQLQLQKSNPDQDWSAFRVVTQ